MIKFRNSSISKFVEKFDDRKIIFFGAGTWFQSVNYTELMQLKSHFAYGIDNNPKGCVWIGDVCVKFFAVEKLIQELDCIIILTSPVYMYEMFMQLKNMNLKANIDCYAFPFMQMSQKKEVVDGSLLKKIINENAGNKIPKVIHSFWFSGEEKPDSYKKCVDTWKEKLQGYEIIEWNLNNYDWHKQPFLERAIELKAWAYAADYARLDVLKEFGGIYLDMDVEVFKPFDDLLCNDSIFSFGNNVLIDLAVMAAQKGNPVVCELLKLYDNQRLPTDRKRFADFFQPIFVRDCLVKNGVKMNGCLQKLENMTVFPTEFFMPMDAVLYKPYEKTEHTYCVHYDNFGWSFGDSNNHEKKMRDNNLLWEMIER